MLLSTPGIVLHTIPYGETSVVARVFTRTLGVRSYLVKGVRTHGGRVKQNLLQPLSCIDMVVYDNRHDSLNHIKELSSRHTPPPPSPVGNALRFFMTEVLYKSLQSDEPMPDLWDYVEQASRLDSNTPHRDLPILFLLQTARHMGIAPQNNHSNLAPFFDLQDGRYVSSANETTLPASLSALLHAYQTTPPSAASLRERNDLTSALIAYFQLHLSSFRHFTSHEILHSVLK